jgi:hypothetical protein
LTAFLVNFTSEVCNFVINGFDSGSAEPVERVSRARQKLGK